MSKGSNAVSGTKGFTKTHGLTGQKSFRSWSAMCRRVAEYPHYANVPIFDKWADPVEFHNWVSNLFGYNDPDLCTIDRIDNAGGYTPGNVRWANHRTQVINRTNTRHLTLNGVTKPLPYWADELGVSMVTLHGRLGRGWSDERTLTTPIRKRKKT